MRSTIERIIGPLLIIGLLMPAGVLLAAETHAPATTQTRGPNWYNVEQATTLLNHMQTLAYKVRRRIAPVRWQQIQLNWQYDAAALDQSRYEINKMGNDLLRLDDTTAKLEPWQNSLVHKITPNVHEIVYQMDAAIKALNAQHNRYVLALTEYPQNLKAISQNAKQVSRTIRTVMQSAHSEQEVAALEKASNAKATS